MAKTKGDRAIELSIRECRTVEIGEKWDAILYIELASNANEVNGENEDGSTSKFDTFVEFVGKHDGRHWVVVMRTDGKPGADDQQLLRAQPEELL
jgi:hypothetical protein